MKKLLLALLCFTALPAMAGNVSMSPIYLDLGSTQKIETITIKNNGTEPVHMQASAKRWTQIDGETREEPTKDIMFGPGMFIVPPGGEQRLRVVRVSSDQPHEMQYRVLLQELPTPPSEACQAGVIDACHQASVNVLMLYKLPLMYRPTGAQPKLTVERVDGHLKVTNHGNATARLGGLADKTGSQAYVLPGSTMLIPADTQGPVKVLLNGQPTTL